MRKKDGEEARMRKEMLETAQGLKAHGVMSKLDLARIRTLCEELPAHPPERVVAVGTSTSIRAGSAHHLHLVNPSAV